jgi:pyridoxamine 5'-phosphate oxidase
MADAAQPRPGPERVFLSSLASRVWQGLARAPHDRHHDWRTPVLATQGLGGEPQARTVVLRQVDVASWTLTVFTDARSPKCAELSAQPAAQLVFWSARLGWQLRVPVRAVVLESGSVVSEAWTRMRQSRAAADYLSVEAPSPLADGGEASSVSPASTDTHHFAVLQFQATEIDWLELHREGHRRARMTRVGDVWPLVPCIRLVQKGRGGRCGVSACSTGQPGPASSKVCKAER